MKILIAYDGSGSADAAIATASRLLAGSNVEAIVLTIWEPVLVTALHATRFGSPMPMLATVDPDVDARGEQQARNLAEHGARLAQTAVGPSEVGQRLPDADRSQTSSHTEQPAPGITPRSG